MATYRREAIMILNPHLTEDEVTHITDYYLTYLEKYSSSHLFKPEVKSMGKKNLAYEVKGFKTGIYLLFTFAANSDGNMVDHLEKEMKHDHRIIKYIVVTRDDEDLSIPKKCEQSGSPAQDASDILLGFADEKAIKSKNSEHTRDGSTTNSKQFVYVLKEIGIFDYEMHDHIKVYSNFKDALKEFDQWYKNAVHDMKSWVDSDAKHSVIRVPESEQASAEIYADDRSDQFYDEIKIEKMEVI